MERDNIPGKWGRAVGIEGEQAAPAAGERRREEAGGKYTGEADGEANEVEAQAAPAEIEELFSPETHVLHTVSPNMNIVDLYEVGHETVTRKMCNDVRTEIPFAHQIKIHGPQGEIVRVLALFDGAAMVAAMCTTLFNSVKHRLGNWQPSRKLLRMANGTIIPSQARWEGTIQLSNIVIEGSFEVFDSGGSWAFLLGKPLLR